MESVHLPSRQQGTRSPVSPLPVHSDRVKPDWDSRGEGLSLVEGRDYPSEHTFRLILRDQRLVKGVRFTWGALNSSHCQLGKSRQLPDTVVWRRWKWNLILAFKELKT